MEIKSFLRHRCEGNGAHFPAAPFTTLSELLLQVRIRYLPLTLNIHALHLFIEKDFEEKLQAALSPTSLIITIFDASIHLSNSLFCDYMLTLMGGNRL